MIRDGGSTGAQRQGCGGTPAAERFCAWANRAGDRVVFSVRPLDQLDDVWGPIGPGVLLGVRQEAGGRRVLWSAAVGGGSPTLQLRRAVAALRRTGRGELHHFAVGGGPAACVRVAAELGKPPLDSDDVLPLAC